jgi:hypothetical protein
MIGIVVMSVSIFAAGIFVIDTLHYRAAQANILNMNVVRKKMVSAIQNPLAWSSTIANNANLKCFLNVLTAGANDCRTYEVSPNTYPFPIQNNLALFDSNAVLIYDSTGAGGTKGLTLSGIQCSTFNSVTGDPLCPIQPTISFRPVCPPGPKACVNTAVIVRVDFLISSGQQLPSWLNADRLSVEVMKPADFCPTQPALAPLIKGPNTTFTNSTVAPAYLKGKIQPSTAAAAGISLSTTFPVNFCGRTQIRIKPSTAIFNPANPNRVCLSYTPGSCEYEWLETSATTWVLNYNGVPAKVPAYSIQSPTIYPAPQDLKFLIQNGMVSFYSDDYLLFYFQQNMTQTFFTEFLPAPTAGDPAGMDIEISPY